MLKNKPSLEIGETNNKYRCAKETDDVYFDNIELGSVHNMFGVQSGDMDYYDELEDAIVGEYLFNDEIYGVEKYE